MPKFAPTLQRFNRTDNRVYVLCAVLWRKWRENKPIGQTHLSILLRRNLVIKSGQNGYSITDLGIALAKRHEDRFKAMTKPEHTMSDQRKQAIREAKAQRTAAKVAVD